MGQREDEVAEGFDRFVLLELLVQFLEQKFAEFLRTFADLEDAGEDTFTGGKPLIVVGPLRIDEYVDLRDEEALRHLGDLGLLDANDLRDLLDNVEIGLPVLDVGLDHVEERLKVLLSDE